MEVLSLYYGRYIAPFAESREVEPRQKALVFSTPQVPSNILDWPGTLPLLRKLAEIHPFMQIDSVPVPSPDILGKNGALFWPLVTGVCGSDKKIIHLGMDKTALQDVPNLPPEHLSWLMQTVQRIPHVDVARILRQFTLGHEIVAMNEEGEVGVLYPIVSCEFKFNSAHEYCSECRVGKQNNCTGLQIGPTRGLSLGTGVINAQTRQELGGGFSEKLVAYENQFLPLPQGIGLKQAVLTDAYACGVNGVETVEEKLPDASRILIIGQGAIGFSVMNRLKQLGRPDGTVSVLVKNQFQKDIVEEYGYVPILLNNKQGVSEAAKAVGASVDMATGKEYVITGGGGGYDIVFDCVGNNRSVHDGYWLTKPDGDFVEIGLPSRIDEALGRKQVAVHFPFWASLGHYMVALEDLERIPAICDRLVNIDHTLSDYHNAFFPKNKNYIKHAIQMQ